MELITTTHTESSLWQFFRRSGRLLFEPSRFFREDFPAMSLSEALAFGITGAWIASIIAFFLRTLNSLLLSSLFEQWLQRMLASEEGVALLGMSEDSFLWSAGSLMLAPFAFLLRILFAALLLNFFLRMFVGRIPYTAALKVAALAFAGRWFLVVPIVGDFLAFVVTLVLTVVGVREVFFVSNRRAMLVVLAPYVLLAFAAFFLFGLVLAIFTQMPVQEFFAVY